MSKDSKTIDKLKEKAAKGEAKETKPKTEKEPKAKKEPKQPDPAKEALKKQKEEVKDILEIVKTDYERRLSEDGPALSPNKGKVPEEFIKTAKEQCYVPKSGRPYCTHCQAWPTEEGKTCTPTNRQRMKEAHDRQTATGRTKHIRHLDQAFASGVINKEQFEKVIAYLEKTRPADLSKVDLSKVPQGGGSGEADLSKANMGKK